MLASTLSRLPSRVLLPALSAQAASIDLAVSTIPGPHGGRAICGAAIEAVYPIGPRLGTPLNITAFGSGGELNIGVALDPAAISDPEGFRECLLDAFGRLVPGAALTSAVSDG